MYIEPDGKIKILRGVPLDNTYDHTLYWSEANDQVNYFASKVKNPTSWEGRNVYFDLDKQSYSRPNRGYVRVEIPADFLYDCNYIMFQNTKFGARWFYAFIKRVNYIANWVTEIEYQIDVMQTWFFDYSLERCYVEREHSASDAIGENTIPENLEIGDYIFLDAGKAFQNKREVSDFSICIASTWVRTKNMDSSWSEPQDANAGFYNGIYSGLHYTVIPLNQSDADLSNALEGILSNLSEQRKEEIVGIFMIPSSITATWSALPNQSSGGKIFSRQKHYSWSGGDINKYEPVNNKLYTYPFNTFYVTSSDGDSAYFKYELFGGGSEIELLLDGAMGVPPEIGLTPINYSYDIKNFTPITFEIVNSYPGLNDKPRVYELDYTGSYTNLLGKRFATTNGLIYTIYEITNEEEHRVRFSPDPNPVIGIGTTLSSISLPNYNFTLSVKNFPMCSWVTDTFKAWLAQNSTRLIIGTATTIAGAIATGGVLNATSASPWMTEAIAESRNISNAVGAGSSVANSLMQVVPAMLQPDHAHGVGKGMAGMANGEFGYHFYYARIKDEYAKIIDDYFSHFGYATKRTKIPNRNARIEWTYTKTIACTITGSIPVDDAKSICTIYDNGITFWNNPDHVGHYELNNPIHTGGT